MNMDMKKFFGEAPEEVKEATAKTNSAFKRVRKATVQIELWKKEHYFAENELKLAQDYQQDVLLRWDDITNSITPSRENAPPLE